jgi:hypothetical protein
MKQVLPWLVDEARRQIRRPLVFFSLLPDPLDFLEAEGFCFTHL